MTDSFYVIADRCSCGEWRAFERRYSYRDKADRALLRKELAGDVGTFACVVPVEPGESVRDVLLRLNAESV